MSITITCTGLKLPSRFYIRPFEAVLDTERDALTDKLRVCLSVECLAFHDEDGEFVPPDRFNIAAGADVRFPPEPTVLLQRIQYAIGECTALLFRRTLKHKPEQDFAEVFIKSMVHYNRRQWDRERDERIARRIATDENVPIEVARRRLVERKVEADG